MKRITVAVTSSEGYVSTTNLRKIRTAMVNAAVLKATELDVEISAVNAKTGHVRKAP